MNECRICRSCEGLVHQLPESMYGTGEIFPYFECADCGALSAVRIPQDLGSYYSSSYYSMETTSQQRLRASVRKIWDRVSALNAVQLQGRLDRVLDRIHSRPAPLHWGVLQQVGFAGRILDVGSGSGVLLRRLADMGFKDLTGIDPFLSESIPTDRRVRLERKGIGDMTEKFDLIMFNHSFEHVIDERGTLQAARKALAPNGTILLRVPLSQSQAWEQFGVNWVQLDPPRHIVLHTPRSLQVLAADSGLEIVATVFDSTAYQFWGSEQAIKGITVRSDRSYAVDPEASVFTSEEMKEYDRLAMDLNRRGRGDQAAFVLRPIH